MFEGFPPSDETDYRELEGRLQWLALVDLPNLPKIGAYYTQPDSRNIRVVRFVWNERVLSGDA